MSVASAIEPNYQLDPAYTRKPPIALLDQIKRLQCDGLLLLDHLTKRSERIFVMEAAADKNASDDVAKRGMAALSFEALRQSPAEIAEAEHGLRSLVLLVDELSRLASPATPKTIRNSRQGFWGSFDIFLLLLLLVTLYFSVAFFWRVDEARNLINQARQAQISANEVYGKLNLLDRKANFVPVLKEEDSKTSAAGPLCDLTGEKPHQAPLTAEAEGLCSALAEQKTRETILFGRLRTWNCSVTQDWATFWIIRPLVAGTQDNGDNKTLHYGTCERTMQGNTGDGSPAFHWERSERRTVTLLVLMANHILPSLLALLGASIYLLRLRQRQRAQSILEDASGAVFARLFMPLALGGLLGLVWTGGGDVINPNSLTLQNITVTLPLFAFALGYAFDPILGWLEGKIRESLLGKQADAKNVPVT